MQRLISWFYSIAYKLENHYLLKTSLTNWLWVLMVLPPFVALLGVVPNVRFSFFEKEGAVASVLGVDIKLTTQNGAAHNLSGSELGFVGYLETVIPQHQDNNL